MLAYLLRRLWQMIPTLAGVVLLVFYPGMAILALALAFNLVGDALRDVLDPTERGRD